MASDVVCRCGRRLRFAAAAGRSFECPECGREFVVAGGPGRALPVAIAVAAGFAVIAVGLLGALVGSRRVPDELRREPVAQVDPAPLMVAPPAVPVIVPPAVEPVPPMPMPPALVPELPPKPIPMPEIPRAGVLESAIEPAGRYRVGDRIRQDVSFARRSAYQIAGVDFGSSADYSLQSTIVISKVNADGSLVATQTITDAKLIDADAEVRAGLKDALEKIPGTKFEIAVAANGDVTAVTGLKQTLQVQPGRAADPARSLRVWSLLDGDAWKELATLTFFQPGAPLKPKATWNRPFDHDWGPLGRWNGSTIFTAVGKPAKSSLERIDFRRNIAHQTPANGADREWPVRIAKADFRILAAGGALLYDPATARVTMADELFQVRGSLAVTLDGIQAVLAMEERQAFRLTIGEPKERDLVGQPPRK